MLVGAGATGGTDVAVDGATGGAGTAVVVVTVMGVVVAVVVVVVVDDVVVDDVVRFDGVVLGGVPPPPLLASTISPYTMIAIKTTTMTPQMASTHGLRYHADDWSS